MSQKRKAISVYKYTNIEGAKHILGDLTLLFKTPNLFNDPNDCDFSLDERRLEKAFSLVEEFEVLKLLKGTIEEQRDHIKKTQRPIVAYGKWVLDTQMKLAAKNRRFDSNPFFSLVFSQAIKKSVDYQTVRTEKYKEYTRGMREVMSKMKKAVYICCFSKRRDSILMWAHYADEFRGVCFEWQSKEMNEKLSEVHYSRKKPHFDIYKAMSMYLGDALTGKTTDFDNPVFRKMAMELLTTKGFDWSYENEIRWIEEKDVTTNGRFCIKDEGKALYYLDSLLPKRVFLGARVTPEDEALIRSLASNIGCEVLKTHMSGEKFTVEVEGGE